MKNETTNNKEVKHSRGLWKVVKLSATEIEINAEVNYSTLKGDDFTQKERGVCVMENTSEVEANAERICLCVNSHDELVEALELAKSEVEDWLQYNDLQVDSFEGNERALQLSIAANIRERLRIINLALNKAKGK